MPTPIAYGDLLYVVSTNGVLAAHQAKTGERVYQQRLAQGVPTPPRRWPVTASSTSRARMAKCTW